MERDASSPASAAKSRDESGDGAPLEGDQPDRLARLRQGEHRGMSTWFGYYHGGMKKV
jgi:hypothetical protein